MFRTLLTRSLSLALIAFALILSACGGGGGSSGAPSIAPATPSITTQPAAASVSDGASESFSVAATGDAPLAYQWRRNGVDLTNGAGISGATSAALTLTAPYAFNASQISVRVSNAAGNVTSNNALLTVTAIAPTITTQPANASVIVGAPVTFTVVASGGTAPLTYQWKRNGTAIAGATAASYTLTSTVIGDNSASFVVDIINPAGTLTSTAALLSVAAAGKTWGAATLISSGASSFSPGYAQVVIDGAGNAITVWLDVIASPSRNALWARRYVAGGTWSAAATIDNVIGGSAMPHLAITPSGTAVATFIQSTANNGGSVDIVTTRFTGTWSSLLALETSNFYNSMDPRVALKPDGAATVVFTQGNGDPFTRVWANRSNAAGVLGVTTMVDATGGYRPEIAVAANGDAIMTWLEETGVFTRSLRASRNRGSGWSAPVSLASETTIPSSPSIRVVADASGNATAVWSQPIASNSAARAVRAARLNATTGIWSAPITLNDGTQNAYQPELAVDSNGNVMAVWYEEVGVMASRYTIGTSTWSSAVAIQGSTTTPGNIPKVAVDAAGNGIAVWLQPIPGDATRYQVWGAHFNATSVTWATPLKLTTDSAAYAQGGSSQEPMIAVNANGEAVVVWYQQTDSPFATGIWARVYR